MLDKYKLIGPGYGLMSKLYSGNAMQHCRECHLDDDLIQQDIKVLFAGAGECSEAIKVANRGASTTVIDISPTMMNRFIKQLNQHPEKDTLNVKSILGDILKHEEKAKYDVVVANFFLTVFEKNKMHTVLDHLIKLCKPDGKLIIGDFSPLSGNIAHKLAQQLYWYAAATTFFALTGNPIHELYDYASLLEEKGLKILKTERFSVFGQEAFQSILAEKQCS